MLLIGNGTVATGTSSSTSTGGTGSNNTGTITTGGTTETQNVSSCSNGIKDGNESDVDCGGTCSSKCSDNKSCVANSDCLNLACNRNNICTKINSCDNTNLQNSTGQSTLTITNSTFNYSPKCVKVSVNTAITFTTTSFAFHPIEQGEVISGILYPASSNIILPSTSSGATFNFTVTQSKT